MSARTTIKQYTLPTAECLVNYYTEASRGRATTTASAAVAEEMLEWFKFVDPEAISAYC